MKLLRFQRKDAHWLLIAVLAAAGMALAAVAWTVDRAEKNLLRGEAERLGVLHARTIGAVVRGLDELIEERRASVSTLDQLRGLRRNEAVSSFRLFDRGGRLVLVSDELDPAGAVAVRPLSSNRERDHGVEAVAHGGYPVVVPQERADGARRISRVFVPLLTGSHVAGVVEAAVDQTERADSIRQQFLALGGLSTLLLLSTLLVGAWQWKRRTQGQREVEARIRYLAEHDPLCGALNRTSFQEALAQATRRGASTQGLAVLCLDLDHFKDINDGFGHAAGDAVLREVVERLRRILRHGDLIARLGGDEFAIIQRGVDHAHDVAALARRAIDALAEPFDCGSDRRAACGVSIGAAIHGVDAGEPEDLLHKADLAMYRAKSSGRGTFSFYDETLDLQMRERRALVNDLRKAVAARQLVLHYQPLYLADGATLIGYEALVRWQHPERGLVPPGEFIPLAEDSGLIEEIGRWVLQEACRHAAGWPEPLSVSVNLSAAQFRSNELIGIVAQALTDGELRPARLELEITESLLMSNTERAVRILGEIGKLGVRIAMDDFGTGYSSLAYLWRFPFDKLKIDRAFTKGLSQDPKVGLIVRAIVSLAHTLRIRVNAEGVETAAQLRALRKHGCDEVQGYLLGRPLPAEELDHSGAAAVAPQRPPAPPNSDFAELPTVVATL